MIEMIHSDVSVKAGSGDWGGLGTSEPARHFATVGE